MKPRAAFDTVVPLTCDRSYDTGNAVVIMTCGLKTRMIVPMMIVMVTIMLMLFVVVIGHAPNAKFAEGVERLTKSSTLNSWVRVQEYRV